MAQQAGWAVRWALGVGGWVGGWALGRVGVFVGAGGWGCVGVGGWMGFLFKKKQKNKSLNLTGKRTKPIPVVEHSRVLFYNRIVVVPPGPWPWGLELSLKLLFGI